jgi:hypothetical protein
MEAEKKEKGLEEVKVEEVSTQKEEAVSDETLDEVSGGTGFTERPVSIKMKL